jgi:hypothetical protein
MNAVCHRCGGAKAGPLLPCPTCMVIPRGNARAVAWLFSRAHLDPDELKLAGQRIQDGEVPDPAPALCAFAENKLQPDASDQPFNRNELIGIGVANLILTPLAGLAVWWGLQKQRPTAASQALRITVPIGLTLAVLWLSLIATRLLG